MFLFFIAIIYLVIALSALMLIWVTLVVAKRDDTERGFDLLDDRISSID